MVAMSLKTKMSLAVSLLVVMLMSAFAFVIIRQFAQQLKESIAAQQFGMVAEMAEDVRHEIDAARQALAVMARQFPHAAASNPRIARQFVDNRPVLHTIFDQGLFLFSPDGRLLAESQAQINRGGQALPPQQWVAMTASSRQPRTSAPYRSATGKPALLLTAPVIDHTGKLFAILAGELDLTKDSRLGKLTRMKTGNTGYYYLFDSNRTIIMHPDQQRILEPYFPVGINRIFDKAINGFNGTEETVNSKGILALTSVMHVPSTNWILAASYPVAEAYAPIRRATRYAFLATSCGVGLSIVMVWLSMAWLTAPLRRFTRHLRALPVLESNEKRLAIETSDEVGELGTAFNTMIVAMEQQQETLRLAISRAENEKSKTEAIIAAIGDGISIQDPEYKILYQNLVYQSVAGEHVGEYCYQAYAGQEEVCADCPLALSFQDGQIHTGEQSNCRAGMPVYLEITASPLRDVEGRIIAGIEVIRDITERKNIEAAISKSAAILTAAQRIAQLGSWELDLEKNELVWSDEIYRIFGLEPQEFGTTYEEFLAAVHPDDREAVRTAYSRSVEEDSPYDIVHRIIRKGSGEIRYVHEQCEHTKNQSGAIIRSLGIVHDVTDYKLAQHHLQEQADLLKKEIAERRQAQETLQEQAAIMEEEIAERQQAQEALRQSERFLNTIIDTEPECVKMLGSDGALLMMNRSGLTMIEADSFEQVKGRCVFPLVASEHRQAFVSATKKVFQGLTISQVFEIVGLKGGRRWLDSQSVPFRDDSGHVVALLSITRDITERKALEAQLFQSQKMEAIGQLAGGIAHDFNNILTAIIGYSSLLSMSLAKDDPQRVTAEQILAAADRAADLTRSLLAFSRKQIINPKPVNLNQIIDKMKKFLLRVIGEDIDLKTQFAQDLSIVNADSGQIEQVLMNLATNARDAMPNGGMLAIETKQVVINTEFVNAHGYGKPGEYVLMTISDTGHGMGEATRKRLFEPFFTTKEVGKGTGLGLSIVYGIIKQHDGYINVYSEPGVGTTFSIYLPLIKAAIMDQGEMLAEIAEGGTETILVADDDTALRELSEKVLRQFGYQVITANDGQDTVAKFAANQEQIDLVILDIIMPKMNGKETLNEIRKIRPDTKVIFISGYTADVVHQRDLLETGLEFVAKPLSPLDLLKKVREVLDKPC